MKKIILLAIPFGIITLSSTSILQHSSEKNCLANPGGTKTGWCIRGGIGGEICQKASLTNCIGTVAIENEQTPDITP